MAASVTSPLPDCGKCGRSPWLHPLRGAYLYCDELGGVKSSYSVAEVNVIRNAIGKRSVRRAGDK